MKNHPKKVPKCVWGYLGGVFMMFPDGLTHFGPSRPQFGSLIILHEACRCLVVCKRGIWGLSRFRGIWGEKSPPKNASNQGQKMPARPTCSLLGLGSPSWYPFRVPTSVYIEIIGRGWDAGHPPPHPTPPPPPPPFFFSLAMSPAHRSKIGNFSAHRLA